MHNDFKHDFVPQLLPLGVRCCKCHCIQVLLYSSDTVFRCHCIQMPLYSSATVFRCHSIIKVILYSGVNVLYLNTIEHMFVMQHTIAALYYCVQLLRKVLQVFKTALLWGIKMQIIDTNVVILVQDIHAASNQIIGTNNLVILVHDIHAASHQIKYLSLTAAASALQSSDLNIVIIFLRQAYFKRATLNH